MKHFELKTLTLALALMALPALAEDAHHPEKSAAPAQPAPAAPVAKKPVAKPAAKPAELPPQAAQAAEQMKKTQELMGRIQKTTDPMERQKLMHEHMQAMNQGMGMMREMGGGMAGGMMMGMSPGRDTKNAGMMDCSMMGGHGMMEKRLDMMQQMMEQLLLREAAKDALPLP